MNERKEPLMPFAAGIQSGVSAKLGDIWWAFMLRGVFAGVLGLFALIWPTTTFTILTRIIGLRKILRSWMAHYNRGRPHSSLGLGIPDPWLGELRVKPCVRLLVHACSISCASRSSLPPASP